MKSSDHLTKDAPMHIRLIPYGLFRMLTAATLLFLTPISVFAFQNSLTGTSEAGSQLFIISIPSEKVIPHLEKANRITTCKIKLSAGRLWGVTKIPLDWRIRIEPEKEPYQVQAEAGHGASWLSIKDIKEGAFDKFLVIKTLSKNRRLKIRAEFSINIPMGEQEKHLILEEKDMLLVPYK
jgi:hypothetical protein